MIKLSAFFYRTLAHELLKGYPEICQFQYAHPESNIMLDVIFNSKTQFLILLVGNKHFNHDFSYQTLLKWIQTISSTEY